MACWLEDSLGFRGVLYKISLKSYKQEADQQSHTTGCRGVTMMPVLAFELAVVAGIYKPFNWICPDH